MKVYILLVACQRFAIWESATVVLTGNKASHTFVGQPIAVAGRYVKMWNEISLAVLNMLASNTSLIVALETLKLDHLKEKTILGLFKRHR